MFINFTIKNVYDPLDEIFYNFCGNNISCNDTYCHKLLRVSGISYLGLTFDKNMRWNLHVNNLVMSLRSLNFSFLNYVILNRCIRCE